MLNVHVENLGRIAMLHVRGHIVIGPEIEALRRSVLLQFGVSSVVLDLARVSRIDARGLGLLLELREQLQSNGVEFLLVNITNLVEQIFRIACLDSVFTIAREEEVRTRNSLESLMV